MVPFWLLVVAWIVVTACGVALIAAFIFDAIRWRRYVQISAGTDPHGTEQA